MKQYLTSSVGRKQIVAITGLALSLFTLMHMAGNLLILVGPEAYNRYGHMMITNPMLIPAEVGLVLMFFVHMGLATRLTLENRSARPVSPSQLPKSCSPERASLASRTMILSGLLMLVFTVLHLMHFKYGEHYSVTYNGVEMRDLYKLIVEKFSNKLYTGWYVFCVLVLGIHLSHGISATYQSLGFGSSRNCLVRKISIGFAFIVSLGFISQPLSILLCGGK